jgi:hypothetical protein
MLIRRRAFVKYLILIPLIWILVVVLFGSSNNNNNEQKAELDQKIINKLVAKAKEYQQKHEGVEHEHLKEKENNGMPPHEDHDHPVEEVKKADEQGRNPGGKIQVNAPNLHDPNAPGNLFS